MTRVELDWSESRYDFDVEGNGSFRLFPSGTNRYPVQAEVLNSYGRRANDNLLLDYGFAMLDNEWDTAEIVCSFPPGGDQQQSLLDRRRKEFLRSSGQRTVRCVRLSMPSLWPSCYCGCCCCCLKRMKEVSRSSLFSRNPTVIQVLSFARRASYNQELPVDPAPASLPSVLIYTLLDASPGFFACAVTSGPRSS